MCLFFPFWIKVGFNVDLKCTRMTNWERVEVLMREYLYKSSSNQLFSKISNNKSQDEMLLSGDWTDSALIEATVDIEKSGPFSGVAGWKDMQGGSGLVGGTISARFCLNTDYIVHFFWFHIFLFCECQTSSQQSSQKPNALNKPKYKCKFKSI